MVVPVSIATGTHTLGPDSAVLQIRTYRDGMAQKLGHDLVLDVTRWSATVTVSGDGAPVTVALDADPRSLRVRSGAGGVKPLSDRDRADIIVNIDAKVLGSDAITFASTAVQVAGDGLSVRGELTMAGATRAVTAHLDVDAGGRVAGTVPLTQSAWGIKPYTAMMGALKVRDDVELVVEGRLPAG